MDCILQQFHARAAAACACKPELDAIAACGTWKRALAHRRAPFWAYWYACRVVKGPWSPGEMVIATDAGQSYWYALDVIKGPWPPGEAEIAKSAGWSYWYARDIIKGPWSPGEAAIAMDAGWAYDYACVVVKGPWRGHNI